VFVALVVAVVTIWLTSASAQVQPRRAGLVAHFPDGSNLVKCVQFAEDSLTGEELLLRSGWNVLIDASYGLGGSVCSINGSGCPADDCFCHCRGGGSCEYWAYWHLQGNEWEYSQTGGGAYTVADGAVDGWSWGPGNFQTGTEPPLYTFDQICNPIAPPPPTQTPPAPAPIPEPGSLLLLASGLAGVAGYAHFRSRTFPGPSARTGRRSLRHREEPAKASTPPSES
jgi:hypothetical protein